LGHRTRLRNYVETRTGQATPTTTLDFSHLRRCLYAATPPNVSIICTLVTAFHAAARRY
jgi:hypothetical protein